MAIKTIITTNPVTLMVSLGAYFVKFLKNKFGEYYKASRCTCSGLELVELPIRD